jgi:hypothetical protein
MHPLSDDTSVVSHLLSGLGSNRRTNRKPVRVDCVNNQYPGGVSVQLALGRQGGADIVVGYRKPSGSRPLPWVKTLPVEVRAHSSPNWCLRSKTTLFLFCRDPLRGVTLSKPFAVEASLHRYVSGGNRCPRNLSRILSLRYLLFSFKYLSTYQVAQYAQQTWDTRAGRDYACIMGEEKVVEHREMRGECYWLG